MKLGRVLIRLGFLLAAASVFVWLTSVYGGPVRSPRIPEPSWLKERQRRPSFPQIGKFYEFAGEFVVIGVSAAVGRVVLRLRLSPVSRAHEQLVTLGVDPARLDGR